jgi:hypothetical protein
LSEPFGRLRLDVTRENTYSLSFADDRLTVAQDDNFAHMTRKVLAMCIKRGLEVILGNAEHLILGVLQVDYREFFKTGK